MGRRRKPDLLFESDSDEYSQTAAELDRLSLDETEETGRTGGSRSLSDGSTLSYDTMTDASSMMGIDVELLLANPSFDAELAPTVFAWFDYACGWMDRPILCTTGIGGDAKHQSLLRESKLKADKAIRNLKFNDALTQAAQEAFSVSQAMSSEDDDTARNTEFEDKDYDELSDLLLTDQSEKSIDKSESVTFQDEEVQAKMKEVSARAAEILKNSLVDENPVDQTGPEQEDSIVESSVESDAPEEQKDKDQEEEELEETAKLSETSVSVKNTDGSPSMDTNHANSVDSVYTASSSGSVRSKASKRLSELRQKVIDRLTETRLESDDESIEARAEENKHLMDKQLSDTVPFDLADENMEEKNEEYAHSDIPSEPVITDLTQIPAYTPSKSIAAKRSRLAALRKSIIGRKTVEVIDILSFEDDDSWTPAEGREPLPSPSESEITSRAIDRKNMTKEVIDVEEVRAQRTQTSQNTDLLSDPSAREAFAGLRRGHLGVRQASHETEQYTLSSSRRDRRIMPEVINDVRRQAMSSAGVERASSHNWDPDSNQASSIVRTRSLAAVRSIDESQRERRTSARGMNDMVSHPIQSKEQNTIQYGSQPAGSRENPMDIHAYLETRKREQSLGSNSYVLGRDIPSPPSLDRSRRHQRELFDDDNLSRSSVSREMDHSEVPRSRSHHRREMHHDSQMYSSVINPSMSRESNINVAEEAVDSLPWLSSRKLSRGLDTRDDPEGSSDYLARGSTVGKSVINFGESRLMRGERSMGNESSRHVDHLEQLRKLEKKITRRLNEVNTDQPSEERSMRSTRSSKHLRKLEQQLAQTLRKEDEKRAAKLKRIREKQQSHRAMQNQDSAEFSRPETTKEKVMPQATTSDGPMDVPEARAMTKYGQLMALRQSRTMHKYMQRSSSRSRTSRLGVTLPES